MCMIVSGRGTIIESEKEYGKTVSARAFTKLVRQCLKGTTLRTVKEFFKKAGLTFTRKSLEKAIPFGIGAVVGFTSNKCMTQYIGDRACSFFAEDWIGENTGMVH